MSLSQPWPGPSSAQSRKAGQRASAHSHQDQGIAHSHLGLGPIWGRSVLIWWLKRSSPEGCDRRVFKACPLRDEFETPDQDQSQFTSGVSGGGSARQAPTNSSSKIGVNGGHYITQADKALPSQRISDNQSSTVFLRALNSEWQRQDFVTGTSNQSRGAQKSLFQHKK